MTSMGLVLAALALPGSAQGPDSYALTGARIFVGTGEVIEEGSLVVDGGLVVSVGASVEIPEGAWLIDARGKTIYPGFIDALGTLGLGRKPEEAAAAGGNGDELRARGPEDRPGTHSWKAAADELTLGDDRLRSFRDAGFTSAVTVADEGIFTGQAAFIHTAGERERDLVVRSPLALRVSFAPAPGRSFPESLMGVIAYVKQAFADAAHYREAWAAYENAPRGKRRPGFDRAIAPLARAQAESWPVLLPAHEAHEIERALDLAGEIGVNPVLYGLHQGYAAAEILRASGVPVVVSLRWPARDEDEDPEKEEPLRVLELRERAPSTPGELEKAGVRFAFSSDGLDEPAKVLSSVRKAIEAGLTRGRAVSALTHDAASIYGLEDRLGSLEPGKMADFFVAGGDVFAEGTRVEMVFVDGIKFDVRGGEK